VDREYQYLFVGSPDHHDFLSHNTGERVNPFSKKGIAKCKKIQGKGSKAEMCKKAEPFKKELP